MAHCRIDDFQIAINSEINSDTDTVCSSGEVAGDIVYHFLKPNKTITENVAKKTVIREMQKPPKIDSDTSIQL